MQSARRDQSEEARGYLQNAHQRVMLIATLQGQLSVSAGADVEIRAYFTQLCQSLGASMIADTERLSADTERLSIQVSADDSRRNQSGFMLHALAARSTFNSMIHTGEPNATSSSGGHRSGYGRSKGNCAFHPLGKIPATEPFR
jgi:hypothetical protein